MPVFPPIERSEVLLYLRRLRLGRWNDLKETKHPAERKYVERTIAALDAVCDMLREEEME